MISSDKSIKLNITPKKKNIYIYDEINVKLGSSSKWEYL